MLLRHQPACAALFTLNHIPVIKVSCDNLKLNDQELDEIRCTLDNPTSPDTFVEYMMSFFNIEMIAITRGAEGSTLITEKKP
jgi:hypothetical protein